MCVRICVKIYICGFRFEVIVFLKYLNEVGICSKNCKN